jgi:hypothetical protein
MSNENAQATETAAVETAAEGRAALSSVSPTPEGRGRRPTAQTVRTRRAVLRHLETVAAEADADTQITARSVASATKQAKNRVALALRWLAVSENVLAVTGNFVPEAPAGRGKTKAGNVDRRQRPELIFNFADLVQS